MKKLQPEAKSGSREGGKAGELGREGKGRSACHGGVIFTN